MYALSPIPCCPCSCSSGGNVVINIGSGSGGCSLQGEAEPEGRELANPGCWYRQSVLVDDVLTWVMWYKDTGTLTPYGWIRFVQLA